ncbi:MAG: dihydropteroate synthase [Bacteroidota bacterium]
MQYSRVEDNHFPANSLLRVKEKLVDLSQPKIMGIINLTDDSFHSESRVLDDKSLINKALQQIEEGADFIDIGAQSSRPGAPKVDEKLEAKKIEQAVLLLKKEFPNTLISIDTYRSTVAKIALDSGADLINDISGGNLDKELLKVVGSYSVPYILMHMRDTPETMQKNTHYENILMEMMVYFSKKIEEAKAFGIKDIIIDPGFGFSKTLEQNFEVLDKLNHFKILEKPIMVGFSRKSMIYNRLLCSPENALNGTTILNTKALLSGAKLIRVHDVKEAKEILQLIF